MKVQSLNTNLIFEKTEATDNMEVLKKIGNILTERGIVESDYVDLLLKSEKNNPTGILMDEVGVALPHTEYFNVKSDGVVITVLKETVKFYQVGLVKEPVDVKIIFTPVAQKREMLTQMQIYLLDLIDDKNFLHQLIHTDSRDKAVHVIKEKESIL